ncbi:hypothetical protein BCR32DRAFT_291937 [Anaeromyces robustus]|uniref:Cilia- and flagella-associated protein 263 n=1 Tax=Anaeromyces robustus TaxID=1754192 RepID=A0A1Y1XCS1_9FUNG|nr:hypothetical protein BCR32DRAFT_291937 [Anaeromyces robustus]|eukprot:ORX83538.1 hypothetical protein BCR32DRAFT_291937 [Anaeromyces robustus]
MANTDVNPTSFVNKDTKLDAIKPLPDLPEDLHALDFEKMTDQELQDLMQNLKDHNENLDIENQLYESYYQRTNPYVMKLNKLNDTTDQNPKQEVDLDTALDEWELQKKLKKRQQQNNRRDDRKKKKKDEAEEEKPMLLTVDQKLEIIGRAHDELKEKIEKKKDKWERAIDEIKAELEEIDLRLTDTSKSVHEFNRDFTCQTNSKSKRTTKINAEKLIKYYEDRLRMKDAVIEKCRLKKTTLKIQKNKLYIQLKQKEEMGEVLHAIDFDQLQIENKQYLAKIDERNSELIKLKMTAGRTIQILNKYKNNLQQCSQEYDKLKSEIAQRKEIYSKLLSEEAKVTNEKIKAEKTNTSFKKKIDEYRVPEVMEYIDLKIEQNELQKKLKNWKIKVEIAEMALKRIRKIWNQIKTTQKKTIAEAN